jgi:predicted 3-demethylubiquinone-9 3-methyltransferase (glyoxalase superfamily)
MSKTVDLSVTITCDTEEEFESMVDAIMDVVGPASGAISGTAWDTWPDDQPQGTGRPAPASNRSERGFEV